MTLENDLRDWYCDSCQYINFKYRNICNNCQKLKSSNVQEISLPGKFKEISIGKFDNKNWKKIKSNESNEYFNAISILSYNILMDKYDAEKIYSEIRWSKQFEEISKLNPDIIGFQEVRSNYLELLKKQHFIKNDYLIISMDEELYGNYTTLTLVKKNLFIEKSYSYHFIASYFSISIIVDLWINKKPLRIINVHLRPYTDNVGIREKQLKEIYEFTKETKNLIILGDFNFDSIEDEKSIDNSICFDVFKKLNPNEEGITFDSSINPLIDWDGIDRNKDRFRTDRIVIGNNCEFKPKNIEMIFNKSFKKFAPEMKLKNDNQMYLSDHFALFMKIEE